MKNQFCVRRGLYGLAAFLALVVIAPLSLSAQNKYERHRIDKVDISFGPSVVNASLAEQYRSIAAEALGNIYSTSRVRDSIEALYDTKNIDTITVAATLNGADGVDLVYNIKRKIQAQKVDVILIDTFDPGSDKIKEEDILFKLNIVSPGTAVTEQTLKDNADEILDFLRERGFYKSTVTYERQPLANQEDVGVKFVVTPNAQARVDEFKLNIAGIQTPIDPKSLKLGRGDLFSRERLTADVATIRAKLRDQQFLAPEIDEPRVTYDSESNTVNIELTAKSGPKVTISTETEKGKTSKATQKDLIPVLRDGTLDYSAIVEGERRLENHYQEQGFFFANVTPVCSVKPELSDNENRPVANETNFLCSYLGGQDLMGREVDLLYRVELGRKLKLTDIRIRGTDKLTYEDVASVLGSQKASLIGIIPILGYGRGYTSAAILEDDAATLRSLMSELGYRDAVVIVNQGVSPTGDELIITFQIEEGVPYVVRDHRITGNSLVTTAELEAQLPDLTGQNFSRAKVRNAAQKMQQYYSDQGYFDARVVFRVTYIPPPADPVRKDVSIEFRVEREGKKVRVHDVLVAGNDKTKTGAILRAVTIEKGDLLKAADVYASEQNLYSSDVFSRVDIKPQPAGEVSSAERLTDVIVSVEEQPARLMSYGGGFSTDTGVRGFFDIRHANLLGNLWHGGFRVDMSQKVQLVQLDFIHPRFLRDGERRFAPLTLRALYQRDSTVTRFFRSAFDQGTFGIVQRVDEDGNPIDEFGRETGAPTINRLGFTAETSRTINRRSRSLVFFRYRFEDVRLFNINSLLIKDLLIPDAKTRISGFTVTAARDTRQNCSQRQTLLDLIAKGEATDPCRYDPGDPTKGDFLTAEYNVSLPALGANIGFHKFQASYNRYYTINTLRRKTTFAGRAIIGMGSVFANGDRFSGSSFPSLNGSLPISERFFAGGGNSIRGFSFEEAGPRVAIVPTGIFRNSKGEPVSLDPFTVPFGGNAIAMVNLEARVGISRSIRFVPFYDGGNVFRRAGDIFKKPSAPANNIELFNQAVGWTHTVGLGLRIHTPIGDVGVDYGRLMNPPRFLVPQFSGPPAIYQLRQDHLHFRFSQAF